MVKSEGFNMKNLKLLVWMTQLGFSVVLPIVGFVWLGLWLRKDCGWGQWSLILCVILGIVFAIAGLRYNLRLMNRIAKDESPDTSGVYFNDHE